MDIIIPTSVFACCGRNGLVVNQVRGIVRTYIVSLIVLIYGCFQKRRRTIRSDSPYRINLYTNPAPKVESIHFLDTLVRFNGAESTFYRHSLPKLCISYSYIPHRVPFQLPCSHASVSLTVKRSSSTPL